MHSMKTVINIDQKLVVAFLILLRTKYTEDRSVS
jgi:hypothetical protein